jgi:hypothetical protein
VLSGNAAISSRKKGNTTNFAQKILMDGYTAKGGRGNPAPLKNAKEKIVNFVEIKSGVLRSGCVSISCADDDCDD